MFWKKVMILWFAGAGPCWAQSLDLLGVSTGALDSVASSEPTSWATAPVPACRCCAPRNDDCGKQPAGDPYYDALRGPQRLRWFNERFDQTYTHWIWSRMWWSGEMPSATDISDTRARYESRVSSRSRTGPVSPSTRLRILMDEVVSRYRGDDAKVCRHHAALFSEVARGVDMGEQFRCGELHAWNWCRIGDVEFIVDAYQDNCYEVSRPPEMP